MITGGALAWSGLQPDPLEAPVLPTAFSSPNATPTGPATAEVSRNADEPDVESMSPPEMSADRLFVPSLGVYASLTSEHTVNGLMTLPSDLWKVGRNDDTAALSASAGTTLLSGHVNYSGRPGALHSLTSLRAGNRAWTTDSDGGLQEWVVTDAREYRKKALPQDLFSREGPRRLALVTCGGPLFQTSDGHWHYRDNVVVELAPVEL